jgi:Domain of unknown function (DUF5134)
VHGPASPGWLLVALCAATGAYCLLRMFSAVEEQRRAAGDEALMGFGMAAMGVPAAVVAPPRWVWLVWTAVFGAAALRALWAARTSPHHLHHSVGALAMVYMAAVMTVAPGEHGTHTGSGVPLLTGAFLLYFTGYVLWSGVRLIPVAGVTGGTRTAAEGAQTTAGVTGTTGTAGAVGVVGVVGAVGWGDRPELVRACRLSMGIAMVAMLLTV